MNHIPFVDAHVHLWDLKKISYPWLNPPFNEHGPSGSAEAIAVQYGIKEYMKDAARWNVCGIVHIDAGAIPQQSLDETEWLEELERIHGLPNGIVAFAALQSTDIEASLDSQSVHPHVRGIRQIANYHVNPMRTYNPVDITLDDKWWYGFDQLSRYKLSFDLQCYASQMAALAPLIKRNPDVPVIINHLGMPQIGEQEGLARWRHGIRSLAVYPNVHIKISGLGFIDRKWTYEIVAPILQEVIDVFGVDRCMFASDFPTDKLFSPFDRYLETYHNFSRSFSLDEKRDMFGRNANRIYRLGLKI